MRGKEFNKKEKKNDKVEGEKKEKFSRKSKEKLDEGNLCINRKLNEQFVKSLVRLYNEQENEGKRKSAHNAGHMIRTGIAAADYVIKNPDDYKLDKNELKELSKLAFITGIIHDMIRLPHEIEGRSDGIVTADLIRYIKGIKKEKSENNDYIKVYKNTKELFDITALEKMINTLPKEDIEMIAKVLEINDGTMDEINNGVKNFLEKGNVKAALLLSALLYGDKGKEGIGPIVVLRRAQFVSGERFERGDLKFLKKYTKIEEVNDILGRIIAYAGESMIRIYAKKSQKDFPNNKLWNELKYERKFEITTYIDSLLVSKAIASPFAILGNTNPPELLSSIILSKEDAPKKISKYELLLLNHLIEIKFPKIDRYKERIKAAIEDKNHEEFLKSNYDKSFDPREVVNTILALALEQADNEKKRKEAERYKNNIKDPRLRKLFEGSDLNKLIKKGLEILNG